MSMWLVCICQTLVDDAEQVDRCSLVAPCSRWNGDVTKFLRKPGHVLVLGDFNMEVGNNSDAAAWDNARAPKAGSPNDPVKVTNDSRRLLHMAEAQDLCFLSGQSATPSGPTCHRGHSPAERSRTTIDHIVASAPLAALIQLEATVTMASGFDSEEVRQCGPDHVPILTACLAHRQAA
jgi:endonuclease/exonuclease/phosphatase family metal-dependent hydrolase